MSRSTAPNPRVNGPIDNCEAFVRLRAELTAAFAAPDADYVPLNANELIARNRGSLSCTETSTRALPGQLLPAVRSSGE